MKTHPDPRSGAVSHTAEPRAVISPVTGRALDEVPVATREGIAQALRSLSGGAERVPEQEIFAFLCRLKDQLIAHRGLFCETILLETGFVARDCMEIVDGAIEYLDDFAAYVGDLHRREEVVRHSYSRECARAMRLIRRPYRCAAAVVPQNASLSLAVTVVASALFAGSRVLLRSSLQSAVSTALLADMIAASRPPESRVAVINSSGIDFIETCIAAEGVDLIHYIGSNQHVLPVLSQAFTAGKACILDGQGNGMLYVDDSYPVAAAVRLITAGATRFNGETCTSINGVLVQESVYPAIRDALVESFGRLRVGDPRDPETHVGPLFSARQANGLRKMLASASGIRTLCGGQTQDNYFTPAIVEGVQPTDAIATEGFFGPAIWIASVYGESLSRWLGGNRFPLCDTVLSARAEVHRAFVLDSRAARICINADPSVESMFEPWGGYPPSGLNPVSAWVDKYQQTIQLDGSLAELMAASPDSATG